MRIEGEMTAEVEGSSAGVKLHVRINAPDDTTELYVTNVHPNCLTIPRERWSIEFLGLSAQALDELRSRDITNLSQLTNGRWTLGVDGLSAETRDEVTAALQTLTDIAIVFEIPHPIQLATLFRTPAQEDGDGASAADLAVLERDIATIGLLKPQEEALRKKGMRTLRDLYCLGRNKLVMTPRMDERGIRKIGEALSEAGLTLPDTSQPLPTSAATST